MVAAVEKGKAIGNVSRLLSTRLKIDGVNTVRIGRPGDLSGSNNVLNLFLYEIQFDPDFENVSMDEGSPPALRLILKYLLTAYAENDTDCAEAHDFLGSGIKLLHELELGNNNPESLKISFAQSSADLISKIMQGPDDRYRCSVAFQVRAVML